MPPALSKIDDLRAQLGEDNITEREGKPLISPRSTQDIAATSRYANENKLAIEILGAGTKRDWANPVRSDLLLSTTQLTGVRAHSWQDLTATVVAGTTWAEMQRVLATRNQHVALDPLWPETATVGGIIAANDSGALRLKYGSLRDLIIGMTIVLADGTIARSGGNVVKNVAGYDLHKLMTGAFGTLGIIAEVNFRLHPLPPQTRTWSISSATADLLGALLLKVLDSQLNPQAMQLRAGTGGYALDIELASLPEVLALQQTALDEIARGLGIARSSNSPTCNPFLARQSLFEQPGIIVKATMLPSVIAKLSAEIARVGGTSVTQATGIMFARFVEASASQALASIKDLVRAAGDGTLTVLRSPKHVFPPWGGANADPIMSEIKRQFDINRVLNPGRFVGAI